MCIMIYVKWAQKWQIEEMERYNVVCANVA